MKKFAVLAFLTILVSLTGCGNADSSDPPNRVAIPPEGYDEPGWSVSVRQAIFSPDNRFLLIAYQNDGHPKTPLGEMIPVYDLNTGQIRTRFLEKIWLIFNPSQVPPISSP